MRLYLRMKTDDAEPLWREVVGDTEPWRRGRWVLVLFAAASLILQLFTVGMLALGGFIDLLMINAFSAAVFWMLFYFIWIGVHWVRWLYGVCAVLYGFVMIVWALGWQTPVLLLIGSFSLVAGGYVGFAPSVYFFALRQRERRNALFTLAVATVFALLLLTLGCAILGLLRYKNEMQEEARDFADVAFRRIFAEHDTYFLFEHVTDRMMSPPYGRGYLSGFLQDATIRLGDVHDFRRSQGGVLLRYQFPATFFVVGQMASGGTSNKGPTELRIFMGGVPGSWRIDQLGWFVPPRPDDTTKER